MNKYLFWLKGYVRASISEVNAERFINILSNHGIRAYRFCIKNGRCYFDIEKSKYKLLLPFARKTGLYPRLHRKCGGYYILRKLFQHTGLYIGIVCFWVVLYIVSMFLWDIRFEGNSIHTDEQLLQFVCEQKVGFGTRKDVIDCTELEQRIREAFPDIGWVSVELRGNRMIIHVKEASFVNEKASDTSDKTQIVAKESGIVTGIIVRNGTPLVKAGDTVKKGDVLICGWVDTVNEYDELIHREYVNADGEVSIKADVRYSNRVPLLYKMKIMTGNSKKGFSVSIGNKKIFSYFPSIPYESYDIITTSVSWKASKNLYLPISHDTISCVEYTEHEARYSNAQLSAICHEQYLAQLEQYIEEGYQLLADDLELYILDEYCFLEGVLTLVGPFYGRSIVVPDASEGVTAE